MKHIYKLGRTCRNCTEARTNEHGLYCVHDQWVCGWEYTRNPRRRALKCPRYLNAKWNYNTWKNDDVMCWNYAEKIRQKLLQSDFCL